MKKRESVDIVIPVYNEETELESSVKKLYAFLDKGLPGYDWNIIVADNASTDGTYRIAQALAKKLKHVKCIHLSQKGRGRAVKRAWNESRAQYVGYMDVDLSTDLKSLRPLLESFRKGSDIAIGSRLLGSSQVIGRTVRREILSRGYNILIKLFFGVSFHDAQCGFKAVTRRVVRDLLPHIVDNAWFFDSEMLIVGEKAGFKVYEEPVRWVDNPGSTVRVLGTVRGDLFGLWRIFWARPWKEIKK
jgi:glycosyltransferase involved in cell wall biosynthesis